MLVFVFLFLLIILTSPQNIFFDGWFKKLPSSLLKKKGKGWDDAYRDDSETSRALRRRRRYLEVRNARKEYMLFIGFFFVMIAALRSNEIGLDTLVYRHHMMEIRQDGWAAIKESRFEPLYLAVSWVCAKLNSFFLLKLIVSFGFISGVFYMIYRYSVNPALSCLLFFCFGFYYMDFNELRQAISTGVACYSFRYLVNKNLWKYLLGLTVAILFHYSAVLLLPLVLVMYLDRIKVVHVMIIALVFFVIMYLSTFLLDSMNAVISIQYGEEEETGGWGLLLLQVFTLGLCFFRKNVLSRRRSARYAFFFLAYSIMIFPICHMNPTLFRLEQHSWILMIILVPFLLKKLPNLLRIPGTALYVLVGLYFSFTSYYTVHNQIIPYLFLWQQ